MKKYLILTIATATEKNKNFAGNTQRWVRGKGGISLEADYVQYAAHNYGYTEKRYAQMGLKAQQKLDEAENKYGYWVAKSEIIEIVV